MVFLAVIWPWVIPYGSILRRMNTHVPPILILSRGFLGLDPQPLVSSFPAHLSRSEPTSRLPRHTSRWLPRRAAPGSPPPAPASRLAPDRSPGLALVARLWRQPERTSEGPEGLKHRLLRPLKIRKCKHMLLAPSDLRQNTANAHLGRSATGFHLCAQASARQKADLGRSSIFKPNHKKGSPEGALRFPACSKLEGVPSAPSD